MIPVALALLVACSDPPKPPERSIKPVRIVEVAPGLVPSREFYGTAQASRTAELAFRFAGKVIEFNVAQGDRVEEGAVVARLDPREWETRERQVASELDSARAVLAQMRRGARQEDVQRLEAAAAARSAEAKEAATQFERLSKLLEEGVVPRSEVDRARATLDVAKAALAAAELELRVARTGARQEELDAQQAVIRGLEARLQDARNNLQDTVLRAPFTGIIARTAISQFEDVVPNQPVATLQDLTRIDVVINVTEGDIGRSNVDVNAPDLKTRTVAFAEFPALQGRRFPLRLKEFQTQADPTVQTYQITLQMEQDSTFPVKPGMSAIVRGEKGPSTPDGGRFLVPVSAVVATADGAASVWVVDPKTSKVTRRAITTGEILGNSIVVIDGLSAGERIAASAASLLREGMQVEQMKDLGSL
jgi:RND family efflux transporter MFP subunit